jgi:hypothetical protein
MTKKITQQTLTGQQGINLIERLVLQMGWIWNATNIDAGIDGYIEIRDPSTAKATNIILQVQSKALSHFRNETTDRFEYVCDARDLEYWLAGNAPVLLVVSKPSTGEAYWVSIKGYFDTQSKRRERRITFDKRRDVFDVNARDRLAQVAMPRFHGIYLTPPPRRETLFTNLVSVARFPESMHRANTDFRDGKEVRRALGYSGEAPDAWFYRDKQVVSAQPFESRAWDGIIDRGTEDRFDTKDWAFSVQPERSSEFLELMSHVLRGKLRPMGVSYYRAGEYFYFLATPDLAPRRIEYKSFRKNATRTVFQGFPSNGESTHVGFYRHLAFQPRFMRFEKTWFLAITPTYHFTFDGWRQHKWYESKLKGIKALEKNPSVLGQVAFWAALLRERPPSLFEASAGSDLQFGELVSLPLEAGINETLWLWNEEDEPTRKATSDVPELPLTSPSAETP